MDALLVIDMQNDFVRKEGALYVPEAERTIPVIRKLVSVASGKGIPVIFTLDWHMEKDREFIAEHWPRHCVRGTKGAEIVRELATSGIKRQEIRNTMYDKFPGTGLESFLREKGVARLFLTGVATEYCVRYTALSALKLGFEVFIVGAAVRPVSGEHGEKVLAELRERGAKVVGSEEAGETFKL